MLKEKKSVSLRTILIVFGIVFATTLTYWMAARPYFATKSCQKIALDNSGYNKDTWRTWAGNHSNQTNYMFIYEMCMQKEGIDPR